MKTCPQCGTKYDARVDFCFKDGEVLVESSVEPEALSVEDEFDRPLPALGPAIRRALDADTLNAAELPEPAFLRDASDLPEPAGLELPEPGNLDAPEPANLPYTQEETAAIPSGPTSAPDPMRQTLVPDLDEPDSLAPLAGEIEPPSGLPDDETRPIPLDQARPIENQAPLPEPLPEPEPEPAPAMEPQSLEEPPQHWPAAPASLPEPQPEPAPEPDEDPELAAWAGGATPEPPPREDEQGRGGPPWVAIGVAALVLLGLGLGAMKFMGSDPEPQPVAPSGEPAVADASGPAASETPAPTRQVKPESTPKTAADPVSAPVTSPAQPSVEELAAAPAPSGEPTGENTPEPVVADVEPAAATEAPEAGTPWGEAPAEPAPAAVGTLSVTSMPMGAQIFIDGDFAGISPVNMKLAQGSHKVRAESAGYKPQTIMVSLDSDKASTHLSLDAEATTRKVMLYGPAGASRVVVNGQTIDALPASIELPVGAHTFTVTLADGSNFQVRQQVQDSDSQNLMLLPPG